MVNTSPAIALPARPESIPARALEYVYVCISAQMPGVFKVGETHRQTPQRRAKQFTGVDKKVTWTVLRAFESPDSRASEKMVHMRLNALGARVEGYREMFSVEQSLLVQIIEECISHTIARPAAKLVRSEQVAVPDEPGPWSAALAMPLAFNGEKDVTLARAMAMAAAGNTQLQRKLLEHGVKLVYPDPENPHFQMYSLPGTKWAAWLRTQGISWADLGIPDDMLSRKIKCATMAGR